MSKEKYDYLKSLDDYHLVNIFNQETSHNGWVSERAYFLKALREAFHDKNISLENVLTGGGFSLKYPVFLTEIEGKKTLIPIKRF